MVKNTKMRYLLLALFFFLPFSAFAADPDYGTAENWNHFVASTTFSNVSTWSVNPDPSIVSVCNDVNVYTGRELYYWNGTSWVGIFGGYTSCSVVYQQSISGFTLVDGREYVAFMLEGPTFPTGGPNYTNATGYISFSYSSTTGLVLGPLDPFVTRIVDITPTDGYVFASTTTSIDLETQIYISPDDYVEGTVFRMSVLHNGSVQNISALQAWETAMSGNYVNRMAIEFPVTSSGYHTYATTTTSFDAEGVYTFTNQIVFPATLSETVSNGFFGALWDRLSYLASIGQGLPPEEQPLISKNTTFVLGSPSWYDTVIADTLADTIFADAAVCKPFVNDIATAFINPDFDILYCLQFLVIPTTAQFQTIGTTFYDNVMVSFPFGYITRFVQILTTATPTQPPALEYTYGTSAPDILQGKDMSFQLFDGFYIIPTIVADDGSDKNIWDIIAPYWDALIALGVLGVILTDLLALGLPQFGKMPDSMSLQKMELNNNGFKTEAQARSAMARNAFRRRMDKRNDF